MGSEIKTLALPPTAAEGTTKQKTDEATGLVIWSPDAGTQGSEGLAPFAPRESTLHHSVAFDTSTWPSRAEQLPLLFWRQSYIFNDLQKSPCEKGGRVEITAEQFALRIKLSSLQPRQEYAEINAS